MAFFSIDNISVATLNWFIMGLVIGFSKTESKLERESETFRAAKRHSTKGSQNGWIVYNKGIASLLALVVFAVSWISSAPSRNLASIFANNEISSSDLNALNLRQYRLLNVVENPFTRETEFKWAAEGFYNLGLEDATIKTLIIGLRKFPRDMVLLDNLAFVYEKKGDFNSAFLIRKKQIDIEKRNWRLYYFAFIDLKNLGRVDEAKGYLSKVLGLYRYMSQEERSQFEDFRREALKDL